MTKSEKLNPPTLRLYENENANKIPILFMTVGIVGSGKSFIAENLTIRRNGALITPIIHSSDALREELYGDINEQSNNADLFAELHKRIKADLQSGKDVVYDATNINKKRRRGFLQELKNINCFKVCLCVMTPYEVCLEQNANRSRKVPEDVIKRMYMNWNPPALEEGFDDIVFAFNYGSMNPNYFTLENFFGGEVDADNISQENHHHTLTIGEHCRAAGEYAFENFEYNERLVFAALTHDIGKVFTKTHINSKGFDDGECHFYQHQCVGSYLILFYCNVMGVKQDDALYISNLIFYHMQPFLSWRNSKKAEEKQRRQMGEQMYQDLLKLHKADLAAH